MIHYYDINGAIIIKANITEDKQREKKESFFFF